MSYLDKYLPQGKILFFDLEYYVPPEGRQVKGLKYNPWNEGSLLLGGSFLMCDPDDLKKECYDKDIKSCFLWNYASEEELVKEIFSLLTGFKESVTKRSKNKISPILSGIGIITSDIPVLLELFKKYLLVTERDAFTFQSGFKVLDLSTLTLPFFPAGSNLLYPKIKKEILSRFMNGVTFSSGTVVWDLYDKGEMGLIEKRVKEEVSALRICYREILREISR